MSRPRVEIAPKSRSPSVRSSASRSSSRGSVKDQSLSVNLWGEGDTSKGHPGAHWGLMAYTQGRTEGDIFYYRQGKTDALEYERGRRPLETTSSWGRSEVVHLSRSGRERASEVLDRFVTREGAKPYSRCQVWGVNALGALERENIVPRGTEEYWYENLGKPSPYIAERLERDGRSWIPNPKAGVKHIGPVDARFRDPRSQPRRQPNRIDISKFEGLFGGKR